MVDAGPFMDEPYCFWKQSVQQKHRYGKKCPPKTSFSGLSQTVWGFLRKKLKNCIWYPIFPQKGYIHFCRPTPRFLKNGCPPPAKIIFQLFSKILFFSKKLLNEKYSKCRCQQKRLYWFLSSDDPLCPPTNGFFAVFSKNTAFFKKFVFIIKHLLPNSWQKRLY